MIKTCSLAMNAGSPGCEEGGSHTHTCWIRNEAVFGDRVRHVFGFLSNGTLGMSGQVGVSSSEYFASERPWFGIVGWSAEAYAFASGGSGHSYSVWFDGGVAGSDQDGVERACDADDVAELECLSTSRAIPGAEAAAGVGASVGRSVGTLGEAATICEALYAATADVTQGNAYFGL